MVSRVMPARIEDESGGVTSVPTLSQWGVMLLSALSALLGLGALQSRRRG